MAHKNPWFLITLDEIVGIQDSLQDIRQDLPDPDRNHITRIITLLNTVRDRRP